MIFKQIAIEELLPLIKIAFDGDDELPKYHIAEGDFAWHTYNEIVKTAEMVPLKFYNIDEIGFTVTGPGMLYSFGINKHYRTKELLKEWFCKLKDIMPTFDCVLHGKNERAIAHLTKQGMTIKEYAVVLKY